MKIEADKVTIGETSMLVGCKITGPDGAWIRFAVLKIPFGLVNVDQAAEIALRTRRIRYQEIPDEPMF